MRKLKKKSSKFKIKIEKMLMNNHDLAVDCMEALIELERIINGIFDKNLDENIIRFANENPSNKKAHSLVRIMSNQAEKEKYDYEARVFYAKELVKQTKQMYGIDLTSEFVVNDNKFTWSKELCGFLDNAKEEGLI